MQFSTGPVCLRTGRTCWQWKSLGWSQDYAWNPVAPLSCGIAVFELAAGKSKGFPLLDQIIQADPHGKKCFDEYQRRRHKTQAMVAIARHLLTMVGYVLTRQAPNNHSSPELIDGKVLTWAWGLDEEA